MKVFRDYDLAIEDMAEYSARINQDIYLCYIKYGRHPYNLEFSLRTKIEMVNPKKPTNCLAVYRVGKGLKIMKDIKKLKESKEFKDETIISYPCGSFAPSWKNNVVEVAKCIAL